MKTKVIPFTVPELDALAKIDGDIHTAREVFNAAKLSKQKFINTVIGTAGMELRDVKGQDISDCGKYIVAREYEPTDHRKQ